MDFFLYIMVFMMGTVFGSFFTLAVYRIPLKRDITHERSFCPKCNHRLEFLDLIPIISYITLGGKCRYCKEKIRIRYLLLEMISGIVFLISYLTINMKFPNYEINKMIYYVSFVLMYVTIAIVIGIDNEYKKINLKVLLFGVICQMMYIVYCALCLEIKYMIILLIASITIQSIVEFIKRINKSKNIKLFNYGTILGICMIAITIIKNYYIYS